MGKSFKEWLQQFSIYVLIVSSAVVLLHLTSLAIQPFVNDTEHELQNFLLFIQGINFTAAGRRFSGFIHVDILTNSTVALLIISAIIGLAASINGKYKILVAGSVTCGLSTAICVADLIFQWFLIPRTIFADEMAFITIYSLARLLLYSIETFLLAKGAKQAKETGSLPKYETIV
jgi:hypothetical protein